MHIYIYIYKSEKYNKFVVFYVTFRVKFKFVSHLVTIDCVCFTEAYWLMSKMCVCVRNSFIYV